MKKAIIVSLLASFLVSGIVMAKGSERRQCDEWFNAECLYSPNNLHGNIHVWYGDDHALCVWSYKFTPAAKEAKRANGWFYPETDSEYFCKWSD